MKNIKKILAFRRFERDCGISGQMLLPSLLPTWISCWKTGGWVSGRGKCVIYWHCFLPQHSHSCCGFTRRPTEGQRNPIPSLETPVRNEAKKPCPWAQPLAISRVTVATAQQHRLLLFLPNSILPHPSAQPWTATWLETSSHGIFHFLSQVSFWGSWLYPQKKKPPKHLFHFYIPNLLVWLRSAFSNIPALLSVLYCGTDPFPRDTRTRQQFVTGSSFWGIRKIPISLHCDRTFCLGLSGFLVQSQG